MRGCGAHGREPPALDHALPALRAGEGLDEGVVDARSRWRPLIAVGAADHLPSTPALVDNGGLDLGRRHLAHRTRVSVVLDGVRADVIAVEPAFCVFTGCTTATTSSSMRPAAPVNPLPPRPCGPGHGAFSSPWRHHSGPDSGSFPCSRPPPMRSVSKTLIGPISQGFRATTSPESGTLKG